MINDLIKELEDIKLKYQLNEINIKHYDTSNKLVKDICDIQLEYKKKKGASLGYNKVPPPYNENYTYLPKTKEELMNEGKMTYGPKTDKSSISRKFVDNNRPGPSMNFVSKGTVDPNNSFACADEIVDLKCEVSLGGEQAFVSDFSKTSFDKTDSDCVFGQVFLDSFHAYVSFGGPNVLGKTDNVYVEPLNNKSGDECFSVNACDYDVSNSLVEDSVIGEVPQDTFSDTTKTPSQENQECPDSSSDSVSMDVPNGESSGTPLETVAESKSQINSYDTCVEETCVDEMPMRSENKHESVSIKEEKGAEINEQSPSNVFENKVKIETSVLQNDHDNNEKDEYHHPSTSHTCASSDQQE
ncbi:hypothetical protein Hanom_Chr04g00345961 [Helianthus anomalus]